LEEDFVQLAAEQVLGALIYIHTQHVVHRDVKPANMLLAQRLAQPVQPEELMKARVLLADFGVADILDKGSANDWHHNASLKGTLAYMAPEVFSGDVCPRSDIWALGVSVYELLCGKKPFTADSQMAFYVCLRNKDFDCSILEDLEMSNDCVAWIQAVLVKRQDDRLSGSQAVDHPWIKQCTDRRAVSHSPSRRVKQGLKQYQRRDTFSKTVAHCIAVHVDSAQIEELTQMFQQIDVNHDGSLSIAELKRGLREVGVEEDDVDALIDSIDANHDGHINFSEFVASLIHTQGQTEDDMIAEAFSVFDDNDDGRMSVQELDMMLSGDGPLASVLPCGTTINDVLQELDSSKDGWVSLIEFKAYFNKMRMRSSGAEEEAMKQIETRARPNLELHTHSVDKLVPQRSLEDLDAHARRDCGPASSDGERGEPAVGCRTRRTKTAPLLSSSSAGSSSDMPQTRTLPHAENGSSVGGPHRQVSAPFTATDNESLHTVFQQLGALLDKSDQRPARSAAQSYESLCVQHAQRLEDRHWLCTARDLRELHSSDWAALELPLKLQTKLKAIVGLL